MVNVGISHNGKHLFDVKGDFYSSAQPITLEINQDVWNDLSQPIQAGFDATIGDTTYPIKAIKDRVGYAPTASGSLGQKAPGKILVLS
jgi:hypothetical protein